MRDLGRAAVHVRAQDAPVSIDAANARVRGETVGRIGIGIEHGLYDLLIALDRVEVAVENELPAFENGHAVRGAFDLPDLM